MSSDYWHRRNQELEILCMPLHCGDSTSGALSEVKSDKREIRKRLRQMSCNNLDLTAPTEKNILDCSFNYEYQRYDGIISYRYSSNIIPLFNDKRIAKRTFFTSSGMGGISSFFISLFAYGRYNIRHLPDIYFETIDILSRFNRKDGMPVYYIDSIQIDTDNSFLELFNSSNNRIVVLDTTCWSYNQTSEIIKELLGQGHICIALRSHTKLDMLGTEYSKLGSVTYYISKSSKHEQIEVMKEMLSNHMRMIGHLGIWATPDAFPAFWRDERFIAASTNRTIAIQKANRMAAKTLIEQNTIPFVLPAHSLFILLQIFEKTNDATKKLTAFIEMFVEKEKSLGLPIRRATGFGFDDVVVDVYYDNQAKKNIVRIAFGDIPFEFIEIITKDLQGAMYNDY
jgi:hypothetical protein